MNENNLDDKQTTQDQAHSLLIALCDEGFDGDAEKLAIALGRDGDEIHDLLGGAEEIDEDLLMKIRGIAQARDLEIE